MVANISRSTSTQKSTWNLSFSYSKTHCYPRQRKNLEIFTLMTFSSRCFVCFQIRIDGIKSECWQNQYIWSIFYSSTGKWTQTESDELNIQLRFSFQPVYDVWNTCSKGKFSNKIEYFAGLYDWKDRKKTSARAQIRHSNGSGKKAKNKRHIKKFLFSDLMSLLKRLSIYPYSSVEKLRQSRNFITNQFSTGYLYFDSCSQQFVLSQQRIRFHSSDTIY